MTATPPDPFGPELLESFRSAFGAWPRVDAPKASGDPSISWRAGVDDWSALADDEVLEAIQRLSMPVVEQRLQNLWAVLGAVVAEDPLLADVHAGLLVESLHNGVPTQSAHLPSNHIVINDAVADFTRHVTCVLIAWIDNLERSAPGDDDAPADGWKDAIHVYRRVLALEQFSIATGSLWQPIDLTPPARAEGFAEVAANWAILFWMSHEFTHAIRARATTADVVTLRGRDLSSFLDESNPPMEEFLCDALAFVLASAAAESLEYWVPGFDHALFFQTTFLAQALAENWQFIRHARSTKAFVSRWGSLQPIVRAFGTADADAFHEVAKSFFQEFAHGSHLEWSRGALLDLLAESPFAAVAPTQTRDSALLEIAQYDAEARLYLTPTSALEHAVFWLGSMGKTVASLPEILGAAAQWEIPPYDETFLSREFYLAVEHYRAGMQAAVGELDGELHQVVVNPRGDLTYRDWRASWPPLADPVLARVMHEIASDRHPLVENGIVEDQVPTSPESRHFRVS